MDELYLDLKLEGAPSIKLTMPFNEVNLLTGMNNVGKSFILKLSWFSTFVLQYIKLVLPVMSEEEALKVLHNYINLCFPLTFTQPEDFTGHLQIKREGEYTFQLSFKNGELVWSDLNMINPGTFSVTGIETIRFASKNTRTFTDYKRYLELIKLIAFDIKKASLNDEKFKKLCSFYPLYDIMWFEDIRIKNDQICSDFNIVPENALAIMIKAIAMEGDGEITGMVLDDIGLPSFIIDGNQRQLDNFGTGTQSIIMLTMYAHL